MRIENSPTHPVVKAIKQWKKDQGIISLTLDEMHEKAEGQTMVIEQKVDGQSALLDYGTDEPKFGSLGGVLYFELPVIDEAAKILRSRRIRNARIVGEMAGYDAGKIIPFNQTESLIKNPKADKTKVHWFPYQILEINGRKYPDDFESYRKAWPELESLFKGASYIRPVVKYEGGADALDKAWDKLVEKENNEGLVIRMSNNKVYKVKPEFAYDLVVVAVGDKTLKNWPKGLIGTTLMAFMDGEHVFRTAGEIGTGWTQAEKAELFKWAQANKVGEDSHLVWVKPEKICEVKWERTTIKEMPAYRYVHGKYELVGKLMSGTIVKPRFIRWRTDKSVNPSDLRLTQIPGWKEKTKKAHAIATSFVRGNAMAEKQAMNRYLAIQLRDWSGKRFQVIRHEDSFKGKEPQKGQTWKFKKDDGNWIQGEVTDVKPAPITLTAMMNRIAKKFMQ